MSPKSKTQAIAERLKLAREFSGLSQGQVAKLLNLHRPSISEIEANRRNVSADELAQFADIYQVSIEWLLDANKDVSVSDDRVQLAARELVKLKPNDLDKILTLLSSLKKSKGS